MSLELKHVTIVGPLAPPAGGMANQTKKLAEFLSQEGLKVNIIRVNPPYSNKFIGKIPIVRAVFRLISYIRALRAQIKQTDVIHILANSGWSWHLFAAPALYFAHQANKPIILNYRGGYAREFFNASWRKVNWTLRYAHCVVVPSLFLKEVFADFDKKAEIVPNVLDINVFNTESRTLNSHPHIIVTRNLEDIYDVATAIKAFDKVRSTYPDATMSIAGTGPERGALTALVNECQLESHVTFVGRLAPEKMANLYKSADVMLNASIVDNTPNSIIEALACGTPVVTTNVGGIPKLVTDEHDALLVSPRSVDDMAQKTLDILQTPALKGSLIEQGVKTVQQFYWANVWQKLSSIYQQAMLDSKNVQITRVKEEENVK